MATEKLFLTDSLELDFEADIVGTAEYEGKPSVLLNRSAFYGQAGGQLGDTGYLLAGDLRIEIIDTQIDDSQQLHHILAEATPQALSGRVRGQVDIGRRRDMMSQHTGQHMVSAAFARLADLDTISARLGSEISTVDLPGSIAPELLLEVEDLVNDLVLQDLPIQPLFPSEQDLRDLNLRRQPKVSSDIRLIDIQGFDITPCGGTHCSRTGQVGPVRILGTERYKGNSRINFLAGKRAIQYLRRQDELIKNLAAENSCAVPELGDIIAKGKREYREVCNLLGKTRSELVSFLARELHDNNPPLEETPRLILAVRPDDDPTSIRKLATTLTSRGDVLAVVACRDPKSDGFSVVVERGLDCDIHVGNWFKETSARLGGRGGGRPERAEGCWPADTDWTTVSLSQV